MLYSYITEKLFGLQDIIIKYLRKSLILCKPHICYINLYSIISTSVPLVKAKMYDTISLDGYTGF